MKVVDKLGVVTAGETEQKWQSNLHMERKTVKNGQVWNAFLA